MIVLTGGIGSGKSVVARILRLRGFGVFDCDHEARLIMETDPKVREEIKEIAGEEAYHPDGALNRKELSRILFVDTALRSRVNEVVHGAVKQRITEWSEENPRNVFVETAIAAESGLTEMADEIWMVTASREVKVQRVISRDRRHEKEVLKIMDAQASEEKLIENNSTTVHTIENNPWNMLLPEVEKLIKSEKL